MAEDKLSELMRLAKGVEMTKEDREKQRRSFAYGNTKVENSDITPEAIEAAAKSVSQGESSE